VDDQVRQRFDDKWIEHKNGCHIWVASTWKDGYGSFRCEGRPQGAHRVAYKMHKGEIPEGMHVCHTCDEPACVNPEHLWVGTDADNAADRDEKGRLGDRRGINNGNARITEEMAREIYHMPGRFKDIACIYRISDVQVSRIKTKESWRHIHAEG